MVRLIKMPFQVIFVQKILFPIHMEEQLQGQNFLCNLISDPFLYNLTFLRCKKREEKPGKVEDPAQLMGTRGIQTVEVV